MKKQFFESIKERPQSYKCKECGYSGVAHGNIALEVKDTGLCPKCIKKARKEVKEEE